MCTVPAPFILLIIVSSRRIGLKIFRNIPRPSDLPHTIAEQGNTGLSKKMDGIWNRYNLKSTGRIYTFCVLKCSEKFKVLYLP